MTALLYRLNLKEAKDILSQLNCVRVHVFVLCASCVCVCTHVVSLCVCAVCCKYSQLQQALATAGHSLSRSISLSQFCTPLEKLVCLSEALSVMSRTPADSAIGKG